MKGWYAALAALWLSLPLPATAAEDLTGAAHELGHKTAALVGKGDAVSVTWHNVSSLGAPELGQARNSFEAALREGGARTSEFPAAAEARITLSENPGQFLLVEEVRKGDQRQVWIAAWKHAEPSTSPAPAISLAGKLVWEQEEPLLDAAFDGDTMLLLSPSKIMWASRNNGQWSPGKTMELPVPHNLPRDPRGRLRISGTGFQADLPGFVCKGPLEPQALECRASTEPWALDSGSRALLLASFAPARNSFEGRVTTQTGLHKTLAPFFSAASTQDQGAPVWLLAMTDGHTRIFDASLEPVGSIQGWGSDIAGIDAKCGGGSLVLATRPGDGTEPDAVQAFGIVNRAPVALSAPLSVPGPVTALWPSGGNSAVAVVRVLGTGKYEAYVLTVACGT